MLETLLVAILFLGALVVIPLLVIAVVGRLLLAVLLLPFRLVGALVGAAAGILGFFLKLLAAGAALILGAVVVVGGLVALPLLPVLLIVMMIWLAARLFRSGPQVRTST